LPHAHAVVALLGAVPQDALESAVATLIGRGAAVYAFAPTAEGLAHQLLQCLHDRDDGWAAHVTSLEAENVWLCAALSDGDREATRAFESQLQPCIEAAVRRFVSSDDQVRELVQRVRVHLLVAEGEHPPRIIHYRGWGSLEAWIRVVTTRLALNAQRDQRAEDPLPELLAASPEFASIRGDRRTLFLRAMQRAFRALDAEARALLRLRYLQGVTATALARSYGVHESTVSRRLAKAREDLEREFTRCAQELVGPNGAIEDLLGALESRYGQSLRDLLESGVVDP